MRLLNRRAQSTGEYAILFAIVLGAVVAMQNFVRNRIAGGIQAQAGLYSTAVGGAGLTLSRTSDSGTDQTAGMTSAIVGKLDTDSVGHTVTTNPE